MMSSCIWCRKSEMHDVVDDIIDRHGQFQRSRSRLQRVCGWVNKKDATLIKSVYSKERNARHSLAFGS